MSVVIFTAISFVCEQGRTAADANLQRSLITI
jgi:hypothetical protein